MKCIYLIEEYEDAVEITIEYDQQHYLITLPSVKKGTMYKGLDLDKEYTLKELGL